MGGTLEGCMERQRLEAARELVAELAEFSYDGLVLLHDDLDHGRVLRGSWAGCVLSYKRGAAGSTRRDRRGRARNQFTMMWDAGALTDEEVLLVVRRQLSRRGPSGGGAAGEPAAATGSATDAWDER